MHLKCMLQWMAASYAGVPNLIYYTFQHEELTQVSHSLLDILPVKDKKVSIYKQYFTWAYNVQ